MENLTTIISYALWGLVGIFIFFGFLIGYKRGFKKSLYFSTTNIAVMVLLLIGLSFVSIRIIFPSAGTLLEFTDKYYVLNDNIREYILNPNLSPFVFAILDIVFKVLLFILVYPIAKFLVKLIIVKPVWRIINGPKPVKINGIKYTNKNNKIKPLKHTFTSRFFGGIFGSIKALTTVILLILPIIFISGAVSQFEKTESNQTETNVLYNLLSTGENELIPSDVTKYLKMIDEVNENGPGKYLKDIKIKDKSIDMYIVDEVFYGKVVLPDNKNEKLKLGEEIYRYGYIAEVLLENGYLDKDFDYKTIDYENDYENIDLVLDKLGESQIFNLALPFGLDYLVSSEILEKKLGFDPSTNTYTKKSFEELKNVKFSKEINSINDSIMNLLKVGNVGYLETFIKNPKLLLEVDQETRIHIINSIASLEGMNLLKASNIGLEYVLNLESVQKMIGFSDNPYEYLHERLDFIFKNPSYLQNDITNIVKLLNGVFSEELSKYEYEKLFKVNGKIDYDFYAEEETVELISNALKNIVKVELISKSIPVSFDYGIYKLNLPGFEDLLDEIKALTDDFNLENELLNIDKIYKEAVNLGVNKLFDGNMTQAIDQILAKEGSFASVKKIVNHILVDSKFIDEGLTLLKEPLLDKFMKDNNYKDLAISVINSKDFKIGAEVVNAIELVENLYKITNYQTLNNNFKNKSYVELIKMFNKFSDDEKVEFKDNLTDFQAFKVLADKSNFDLLVNQVPFMSKNIVTPENINHTSLKSDINILFDMIFEIAYQIDENNIETLDYKDLELGKVLDKTRLSNILTFDKTENNNSIIVNSLVHKLNGLNFKIGNFGRYGTSDLYKSLDPFSKEWIDELNSLTNGALDLVDGINTSTDFTLTINNLKLLKNDTLIGVINSLIDENKLGTILNSNNIRYLVTDLISKDETNTYVKDMVVKITNDQSISVDISIHETELDENGYISKAELLNIFKSFRALNIESTTDIQDKVVNNLFNLVEDGKIDNFLASNYIRTLMSRALVSNFVKGKIATSASFDKELLTLDRLDKDENQNMSKLELISFFESVDVLGIKDINNINISNEAISNLDNESKELILESNYFYQVIDLSIKTSINPLHSSVLDEGNYIIKPEILKLFDAFSILEGNFNVENMKLSTLELLIALKSNAIDYLSTNEIKKIMDVPEESMVDDIITTAELGNLIAAIKEISVEEDPIISSIDLNNLDITTTKLETLLSYDSRIIVRLISKGLINQLDALILDGLLETNGKDIKKAELINFNNDLMTLGIVDINEIVNVDLISIDKLIQLTNAANETSTIMLRKISNSIKDVIGNDYVVAVEDSYITKNEQNKLFVAVQVLGSDLSAVGATDFTTIPFSQITAMNNSGSLIIRRLISKSLINSNLLEIDDTVIELVAGLEMIKEPELTNFLNSGELLEVDDVTSLHDKIENAQEPELLVIILKIDNQPEEERSTILKDTVIKKMAI